MSFGAASGTVAENGGTRNVAVSISPAPAANITVNYTVSGTAGSSDFSITGSGTVTVAANSSSVTIPVGITDDSVAENSETVILTLSSGTGYAVGSTNVHTLTITDDDTPPAPALSISGGGAVTEGSEAVFTVTASAAQGGTQTVLYILSDATGADFLDDALEGDDGVFFLPRNATSYSLRIATADDSVVEQSGDITVTLRLRSGSNYVLGSPSSATVGVEDDDPGLVLSTVSLAVARGGAGRFSLKLDTAPTDTVTVTVSVSDGNGWMVDTDPGSPGKQTTLLFSPANWNQPQQVVVSAGQEASPCGSAPTTVSNAQLSLQDQSASKMADFDEGFFGSPGRGAASPSEKLGGSMQKPFRTEFPMLRGHSMGEVVRFS